MGQDFLGGKWLLLFTSPRNLRFHWSPKLSYSMNKIPHSESYIICYVRLTVKFLVLSFVVFADTKYTMTC